MSDILAKWVKHKSCPIPSHDRFCQILVDICVIVNLIRWNVTVRCTDIEGAFVDSTFQFEILNENDAPKSAKVGLQQKHCQTWYIFNIS